MIVCYCLRWRRPAVRVVAALILVCALLRPGVSAPPATRAPDDGFAARHPRLLFSSSELPLWRGRVLAGGAASNAYTFIRERCYGDYLSEPLDSMIQDDAAQEPMLNLALVSHFEAGVDSELVNLGRTLTLHIARTWNVSSDPYLSSLRLRALALGFDHFFVNASPSERDEIRAEVGNYVSYMTTNLNYDIWRHRPYVSNKTAMVSASLGLAGICFQDELDPALTAAALNKADEFFQAWRDTHLASDGCYREGSLYAMWSMRHLIYYFEARKRFDGVDYAQDPLIRGIERWLPYELDPRGGARVNNIQDQTDYYRPLARHTTYWAWAQREWRSGIAAYMWDHSAGPFGADMQDENDRASTVLWHDGIAPLNPGAALARGQVWPDRGLYYFRTGWGDGAASDDVVFSFYSGEFRGGHAQEDQNQFTLAAYGEKLVFDQGAGYPANQTDAHNLVRIDGLGQHSAGNSIGTDGRLCDYITTTLSDYVCGDATLAYTTHSPYNNAGVPYPWSNWSWGFNGANPVEYALRKIVVMHGDGAPPYFVIRDDVKKDASSHNYDWCLHVPGTSVIDSGADPIAVDAGNASLRVYPMQPAAGPLTVSVMNFDNVNADPNSRMIRIGATAVDPHFSMVLLPLPGAAAPPDIERDQVTGAALLKLEWESGIVDDIVMRTPVPGGAVSDPFPWAVESDGPVVVVRKNGPQVIGYTLVDATWLMVGAVLMAAVHDGPASMVFDGNYVHINRPDAEFRVRADAVSAVFHQGTQLPSHREGEFLVSGYTTGARATPGRELHVRAYPNPFNPSVRVSFVNPARGHVQAVIYDAAGRAVRTLLSRAFDQGEHLAEWDGRDDAGARAASGVYFLRMQAGGQRAMQKLVLLR